MSWSIFRRGDTGPAGRNIPSSSKGLHRVPGDPPRLIADAARATQELQWQPCYNGLPAIIETAWKWLNR
jgi:UDP-glucose 4-epimerase